MAALAAAAVFSSGSAAHAFELHPHVEGAAAHFIGLGGGWQAQEIGPGMIGTGALELPLTRHLGLEGRLLAGRFLQGSQSQDPSIRRVDQAGVFGVSLGFRVHPIWEDRGLWLGGSAGSTQTGGLSRAIFDARIGWDFRLGLGMRGGPFVGYFQVIQPNSDAVRPEDGRVALLGLHLAFDDYTPPVAAPTDSVATVKPVAKPAPKPAPKPTAPKPAPAIPVPPPMSDEPFAGWTPTPAVASATVAADQIVLSDRLYFEVNSATIRQESKPLLESVAQVLLDHPEIELVEIQGHTDDLGTEEWNQKLSLARAAAVRKVLIAHGISADRLAIKGFGKTRPIADAADETARQQNRRVEFVIQKKRAQ